MRVRKTSATLFEKKNYCDAISKPSSLSVKKKSGTANLNAFKPTKRFLSKQNLGDQYFLRKHLQR